VRKNFSPIGDIAERLSGDPCAPEKICTPQEFASLSMGSNPGAPARKKKLAGAEGFENEPFMLKDSLKSLISSVLYDLGRPTSYVRESVLKRFYTLIGIKTVVRNANALHLLGD